ncbi:MAG TPA: LCP family protein [Candidatus Eisenbacteria bacterium]|nr:LCP family protein [Candidatus Eisenbacteria bacterium]
MRPEYEPSRRGRSPFAAAFLSLLFPGLGHAYLGAFHRAAWLAVPPILAAALVAGFAVRLGAVEIAGFAVQTWFIAGVFLVNLLALGYRAAAILDAWRIARWLTSSGRLGGGPAPRPGFMGGIAGPLSLAGLVAVLLVMSTAHVAVARYDLILAGTASCVFDPENLGCRAGGAPEPGASSEPIASGAEPSSAPGTLGPAVSASTAPPWDGKSRLNILLLGADEQGGAHNTDTMITVSIDPATNQVVLFTIPRDTVDVPVPPGPARIAFGPNFPGKINNWFSEVQNRPDLFAGSDATRGYNGLKSILGQLYGLDIRYFVEVNFDGFERVVDALGGVTINVQIPVLDDQYPLPGGVLERLYIPAGLQHMSGTEALAYSRSRKTSTDFDRAARQQRVLVSLRRQTDIAQIIPSIDTLAEALKQSVRTDMPRELVPQLLNVAERIGSRSIRSVIFAPPFYGEEIFVSARGYVIEPNVTRIRTAVREAFTIDPAFALVREAIAQEGARIWVLNGSGRTGEATNLAAYLESNGLAATAPQQQPDTEGLPTTTIRAYNGAEDRFPLTIAALKQIFEVAVEPVTDATVPVDLMIITGQSTPQLTPPPLP